MEGGVRSGRRLMLFRFGEMASVYIVELQSRHWPGSMSVREHTRVRGRRKHFFLTVSHAHTVGRFREGKHANYVVK